jgi:DNA-directed RNA polymerase beta' subunit
MEVDWATLSGNTDLYGNDLEDSHDNRIAPVVVAVTTKAKVPRKSRSKKVAITTAPPPKSQPVVIKTATATTAATSVVSVNPKAIAPPTVVGAREPLEPLPRPLTSEEIETLCSRLKLRWVGEHTEIEESILEFHRNNVRVGLAKERVKPSKIPALMDIIVEKFYKSLITPGEAVGVIAAQSIGEPTTQQTLNSIAPDEKLLIQGVGGNTRVVEIGPWIDELLAKGELEGKVKRFPENCTDYLDLNEEDVVYVPSPDETGKMNWDKVTAITRHYPVGDLVKVTSRSGRTVTATKSKSLLVWEDGKLVGKGGGDVKIGDLVPIICDMPEPRIETNFLNLREWLSPKEWVYGSELNKLFKEWSARPSKQHGFWTADRMQNLPYARSDSAIVAARMNYAQDGIVYPKDNITSVKSKIPEQFPLDLEFGKVVGLYLAEGWATDTFVGISNNEPVILDLVRAWCERYGVTHHTVVSTNERFPGSLSTDLKIHSVLLARWFKKWMGTGCIDKKVPEVAYTANKDFVKGILDGYMAGDGTVSKKDGSVIMSSISEQLIVGIGTLCTRFGILGKKCGSQTLKNNVGSKVIHYTHIYTIRNEFAKKWSEFIGSCHPPKAKLLETITGVRSYKNPHGSYFVKQNAVMLDTIEKIEDIAAVEYVYDITIPQTLNFSLWNSLCLKDTFHHTGQSTKNVTLGFPRAKELFDATPNPSNPTCNIYFTKFNSTPSDLHVLTDKIAQVTMEELINTFSIHSPDSYKPSWWQPLHLKFFPIPDTDSETEGATLAVMPHTHHCLRIKFNIDKLFQHDLPLKQIANTLSRKWSDLIIIYSPLSLGELEIWADCSNILQQPPSIRSPSPEDLHDTTNNPEDCKKFYMSNIVSPTIRGTIVSGVLGINKLYPRKITPPTIDRREGAGALGAEAPATWIVDTDGNNLDKILQLPGVDTTRTISNDFREICKLFGIEAARSYLIMEFHNIISSGDSAAGINKNHIKILVDKMTYTGSIRSVARHGVEESQYGPITRASFEEVMSNLINGAIYSEEEPLNGISSNVALGKLIAAGTGLVSLKPIKIKVKGQGIPRPYGGGVI